MLVFRYIFSGYFFRSSSDLLVSFVVKTKNMNTMKRNFWIILLAFFALGFYACDEDDDPVIDTKQETISMGANYASDIYYSLSDGVVAEVSRTNWDVAFSVDAMSSSILINDGAGVTLKEYPNAWQWPGSVDTTGYSTWDALYNSDADWEEGAFGQNATGHPNYGWGEYDMTSHNVEGAALYIVKLIDGQFKQIFIEVKDATNKEYIFKYADLDGTNEVTETISIDGPTSNYVYYSIVDESVVTNREPDASSWDLLFTKYIDNEISYNVTGVKQNIGVQAIEIEDALDLTIETYNEADFSDDITEIGSDWKEFDMGTFQYTIDADRIYFVKDQDDKVYKIIFTDFEGSSSGNMGFEITGL